jgi:phage gp45-like
MDFALYNTIQKMLAPLKRKVKQMVVQAIVDGTDDGGSMQLLSLTVGNNETLTNVPHLQPFGITARPSKDARTVVLFVNGNRDIPVALNIDETGKRPINLEEGEVAVYKDQDNYIKFDQDNNVLINCTGQVKIQGTGLTVDAA